MEVQEMVQETNAVKQRWFYLVLGTMGMLVAGVVYAWSILKAPLTAEFGWDVAQLALNYTLIMVFVAVGNLLAGALYGKISHHILISGSAVLVFLSFFLTSKIDGSSIIPLYVCYAGMGGIGIGSFVVLIMSVVGSWFPDRKGFCAGTMNMGFGFSAMLLGSLASRLIAVPDFGWRKTYVALAMICGSVLLIVAVFTRVPKDNTALPAAAAAKGTDAALIEDVSTLEMFRRLSFWQYYIFSVLVFSLGSTVISFAADFFRSIGSTAAVAVLLVSVVSVSNGLGRLGLGIVFDKGGRAAAMHCTSFMALAATVILIAATMTHSIMVAAIGAFFTGFSYGGTSSMAGPVVRIFGNKHFAANYSIMLTFSMVASIMATIAGRVLAGSGSYLTVFYIFLPVCLVAVVISFLMKRT